MRSMLDAENPPRDPSLAAAYWCDVDYLLAHTATGDHPPCRCAEGEGHHDPDYHEKRMAFLSDGEDR